jgi:hypothetical protein
MKSPPKEKPGAGEQTGQISKRLRGRYRFPDPLQATFRRLGPSKVEKALAERQVKETSQ